MPMNPNPPSLTIPMVFALYAQYILIICITFRTASYSFVIDLPNGLSAYYTIQTSKSRIFHKLPHNPYSKESKLSRKGVYRGRPENFKAIKPEPYIKRRTSAIADPLLRKTSEATIMVSDPLICSDINLMEIVIAAFLLVNF